MLEIGQAIKFEIDASRGTRVIKGTVLYINTHHFTVQLKNYRESFKNIDIIGGVKLCKI